MNVVKMRFRRAGRPKKKDPNQFSLFSAQVFQLRADSPYADALTCEDTGDIEGAKILYEDAIERGDSRVDAYCNLGILVSQEGDFLGAFDCFTKSLKIDPRNFNAHYNLACLYMDEGDFGLAKLHFEIAGEIDPTRPDVYYNIGAILGMDGQYDEAIQVLTKYKRMVPNADQRFVKKVIETLKLKAKSQ